MRIAKLGIKKANQLSPTLTQLYEEILYNSCLFTQTKLQKSAEVLLLWLYTDTVYKDNLPTTSSCKNVTNQKSLVIHLKNLFWDMR